MGQQVGGHEGAVAVATDGDAIAVRHAQVDHRLHRRLGVGGQLFDVGVVGLGPAHTDDRHRGVVEDGVALGQQEQVADAAWPREAIGGVDRLAGHPGVGELGRIGPHQHRQRPVAGLVVAGRQIERTRQLHPVGACVFDLLLGHLGELRGRIGEVGQRGQLSALQGPQEIVRGLGPALTAGDDAGGGIVGHVQNPLVVALSCRPQPLRGAVSEAHRRQEGEGALGRVALTGHQHRLAVGGEADHGPAVGQGAHQHIAGIVIATLVVSADQHPRRAGGRGVHRQSGLVPAVEPGRPHQREIGPPPVDAAKTFLQVDQHRRLSRERRGLHQHPVVDLDLLAGIAVILGLGPDQGCVGVVTPADAARSGDDRVERRGQVVGQRPVDHGLDRLAAPVEDQDLGREPTCRHDVAVGTLQPRHQDVAAVGRDGRTAVDAWLAHQPLHLSADADLHQLAGEIVVEQGLVVRRLQQVLGGAHGGRAAAALLHQRTAGRHRGRRGRAASGRNGSHQQAGAVRQPAVGGSERAVHDRRQNAIGPARIDLDQPQLQPVAGLDDHGQPPSIRRPGRGEEAQAVRQPGFHPLAALDRRELQRAQVAGPRLDRAVGAGVQPGARQPQDRL